RKRPWLIGNLSAFDDALAAGPGAVRAIDLRMHSGLRVVILEIPVGCDEGLPDAAEIGMAVSTARRAVRGCLRERDGGCKRRRREREQDEPTAIPHVASLAV